MDSPPKTPCFKGYTYNEINQPQARPPQTPPINLPSIPTIPNGPSRSKKRPLEEEPTAFPSIKPDWAMEYKGLMNKYHIVSERMFRLDKQGREMAFHYRMLERRHQKLRKHCKCIKKEDDVIELN